MVVPVWSRSLQVALHVFGKYADRVPHMTVKAHSASHKFHDIYAKWLLAILPVNFNKKNLGARFSVCCVQISHGGEEITREDDRENVTTLPQQCSLEVKHLRTKLAWQACATRDARFIPIETTSRGRPFSALYGWCDGHVVVIDHHRP